MIKREEIEKEILEKIKREPTKYGLVPVEKVQGLVDALKENCSCAKAPVLHWETTPGIRPEFMECKSCRALVDWEKIKGGE